ncbi:MAG: hypothetical protein O2816_15985 [Planctomycetota bacterium]|nr:hypothetical protein [Planctomycetota bacterium]
MLSIPLLFAASPDELHVASFQPAEVHRFQLPSGAALPGYGPSPLAGTLGFDFGPDGMAYVASEGTDEVLRFDPSSGAYLGPFVWDDPNTGTDETGGLVEPSSVAFSPDGDCYVASFSLDAVLRYDGRSGAFLGMFVQPGDGSLDGPDAGMTFGPDGDLYVPSFWNHRVKRYDGATGAFVENFLKPTSGLTNPRQILFVGAVCLATSEGSDQVLRFDAATGDFIDVLVEDDPNTTGVDESGGLDGPTGMAVTPEGLVVASISTSEIKLYDLANGTYLGEVVTPGSVGLPTYLRTRPRAGRACLGAPNSVTDGAYLAARGSSRVSGGGLSFHLSGAPAGQLAVLVVGTKTQTASLGDGLLCLKQPGRVEGVLTSALGQASYAVDLSAAVPGQSYLFQVVYRDVIGTGLNTSDAVRVLVTP